MNEIGVKWAQEQLTEITEAMNQLLKSDNKLIIEYLANIIGKDEIDERRRNLSKEAYKHFRSFRRDLWNDCKLYNYMFDYQTSEVWDLLAKNASEGSYDILPYFKRQVKYCLGRLNSYEKELMKIKGGGNNA